MKPQRTVFLAALAAMLGASSLAGAQTAANERSFDGHYSEGQVRYGQGRYDVFTEWDRDGDRALSEREVDEAGRTVKILEFGFGPTGAPVFGRDGANDDRRRLLPR